VHLYVLQNTVQYVRSSVVSREIVIHHT